MIRPRKVSYWHLILKGVAIVYVVSAAAGFLLAFVGITPERTPTIFPLFAMVTEAGGVALALRVVQTTRWSYLLGLGAAFWLVCGASVMAGAQPVMVWVASGVFVAATVILGQVLYLALQEPSGPPALPLRAILHSRDEALLERQARSFF